VTRQPSSIAVLSLAVLLHLSSDAFAAPPAQPLPRNGAACPSGYFASGAYCKPGQKARFAVPRHGSACPTGYFSSGSHCVASREDTPLAIEQAGGGSCPSGFFSSGAYCVGTAGRH
jgi:hypothetical protein